MVIEKSARAKRGLTKAANRAVHKANKTEPEYDLDRNTISI